MSVLVLTHSEIFSLLSVEACIPVMADALKALARGEVVMAPRQVMWLSDKRGAIGAMPAHAKQWDMMGIKAISFFPANRETPYDTHQGAILLFETAHGQLEAIVDASAVTAIRTAAVSGVATQLLANKEAVELTILGSGIQAQAHLEAMLAVRPARQVRVWSRSFDNAKRFAARQSSRYGIAVEPVSSARDAVAGAHIVCTTTVAQEPILKGQWIPAGAHINAIGASTPMHRELDAAAVAASRLFVDSREAAQREAGDFVWAKKEGAVDDRHILAELGEILVGASAGRTSAEEITLFKSVGLAIEDLACGHYLYSKALEKGIGHKLELGGLRRTDQL